MFFAPNSFLLPLVQHFTSYVASKLLHLYRSAKFAKTFHTAFSVLVAGLQMEALVIMMASMRNMMIVERTTSQRLEVIFSVCYAMDFL